METDKAILDLPKQNSQQIQEQELITDFSVMFKGKNQIKKAPKLSQRQIEKQPNWLLQIPSKLTITKQQMCERKALDQRRWKSMVKCSQQKDRILASVISIWNYLYSTKGNGPLQPLTLNSCKKIFEQGKLNYSTDQQSKRKDVLLSCFSTLCLKFNVQYSTRISIKLSSPEKIDKLQNQYLTEFLEGLRSDETSYIYLTYNNVLVPLGFDKTPLVQLDAFKKLSQIKQQETELWIINSPTSRFQQSFLTKRWRDVKLNLETVWPYYTDLQESKKGAQKYPEANEQNQKQERGNFNCIIQFKKKLL